MEYCHSNTALPAAKPLVMVVTVVAFTPEYGLAFISFWLHYVVENISAKRAFLAELLILCHEQQKYRMPIFRNPAYTVVYLRLRLVPTA